MSFNFDEIPNPPNSPIEKIPEDFLIDNVRPELLNILSDNPTKEEILKAFAFYDEALSLYIQRHERKFKYWANTHTHGGFGGSGTQTGVVEGPYDVFISRNNYNGDGVGELHKVNPDTGDRTLWVSSAQASRDGGHLQVTPDRRIYTIDRRNDTPIRRFEYTGTMLQQFLFADGGATGADWVSVRRDGFVVSPSNALFANQSFIITDIENESLVGRYGGNSANFGIATDKLDNTYVGRNDGELRKFDSGDFSDPDNIVAPAHQWDASLGSSVRSIRVDNEQNVYARTDARLYRYQADATPMWNITTQQEGRFALSCLYDGGVVFGDGNNVLRYTGAGNNVWIAMTSHPNEVLSLDVDPLGNVYSLSCNTTTLDTTVKKHNAQGGEVWSQVYEELGFNKLAVYPGPIGSALWETEKFAPVAAP